MYYNINALVLNTKIAAEADKHTVLYTAELGKISAIFPGAKKIKAKFAAASEPVTQSRLMVYMARPNARPKVTAAKLSNGFMDLRSNWKNFAAAQACSELLDALTPYDSQNEQKYELLLRAWTLLETAQNPWRIFSSFALRFLKLSGYNFVEFIKTGNLKMNNHEFNAICTMATKCGQDIDCSIDIDISLENKVLLHLDRYIEFHLSRRLSYRMFANL